MTAKNFIQLSLRSSLGPAFALGLSLSISACGGSSGPKDTEVRDQAGRTCSVPISDIDPTTCDAKPMPSSSCTSGASACFQVGQINVAAQYKPAAICAACCGASSSNIQSADCSPIVCDTDADCPSTYGTCRDHACYIQ